MYNYSITDKITAATKLLCGYACKPIAYALNAAVADTSIKEVVPMGCIDYLIANNLKILKDERD